MKSQSTISFVGAGNLAWHLAPALDNMGFVVTEVYSKNRSSALALTERLYQAELKASLDFSTSSSSIFFVTASDDALEEIAQEIILPDDALLVHTSGSQPLSILQYAATNNIGVFYPLQTFSKTKKIDFKNIPIFIESNSPETQLILTNLAKAISNKVERIASNERKALHVAAVFASNFTNHMLTLSRDILQQNSLDFELLKPLIVETINKGLELGPQNSQTGPAKRGDLNIIESHIEFLSENKNITELYQVITNSIIEHYRPEQEI
jgi:predicted short-subunit dehydrogenase-like oxidoreductase (DUF2520 family)